MLRERIAAGALPAGTPIRETRVASELAVSRNTLREGLRLLAAAGLVDLQLYRGAVVKTLSPAEIRDIYVVRRALELRAVEESAFASQAAFDAVGVAVERAEGAALSNSWETSETASLQFHQAIVALLGSPLLNAFFRNVVAQLRLAFAAAGREEIFQPPWVPRERAIYDFLRNGARAEAVLALRAYLDDSERVVLDVVRAGNTATARTAG